MAQLWRQISLNHEREPSMDAPKPPGFEVDRYKEHGSVARRTRLHRDGIMGLPRWVRLGRDGGFGPHVAPERVPIGVVKLLRARGGCLGVIRWRAWKAAKSPGELPHKH